MAASGRLIAVTMVVLAMSMSSFNVVFAADPDMLQDICVADLNSKIRVNGFVCKEIAKVEDFTSDVLAEPGNAANTTTGAAVTTANVMQVPGLNTLGVSMARIDYAPGGLNPPHTHPRASEMIFVLEGELEVAFITTANVLFITTIKKGDVFVFPRGLVHFQKNNGHVPAAVISGFNSQLPGTQQIAVTLFAADPPVPVDVLAQTFHISIEEAEKIKARFAPKK